MGKKGFATVGLLLAYLLVVSLAASRAVTSVVGPLYSADSLGPGGDVGATAGDATAIVAGDLDNDGDADLVSGDASGAITLWQNDGTPFTGLWPFKGAGNAGDAVYALALSDLDHDGDLDLVSGAGGGAAFELMVWQNDGTPFDGGWAGNGVGGASAVRALAVADLDHDALPDIISGDVGAVIGAWRNDGTPFTGLWTTYQMVGNTTGPTYGLDVADLDNDGDLDVASGDANRQVLVWQNDGSPFAGVWTSNLVGTSKDAVNTVALADLNADGDVDIISDYEHPSATDYKVAAWQNDGTPWAGTWSEAVIGASGDAVNAVAVGDLDNDGDPDVIAGAAAGGSYEVMAWYNPASPFVDPWTQEDVGTSSDDVYGIALADLDRDGNLDAVSASGSAEDYELIAWQNKVAALALGSWVEVTQPAPVYDMLAVSLADFDHDGALDIAAGVYDQGLLAWRGNGGSVWTRVGATDLPGSVTWWAVDWGQINHRTDIDLAAASKSGLSAWLAWEGGGAWDKRSAGLPNSGDYHAVALGDLDNDGNLDLVGAGDTVGVGLWQGNGGTGWSLKKTLDGGRSFCDLRLGHVNHDGNLDIVAAHCGGGGVRVWLGDGGWSFNAATAPASSGSYQAVALGDINRDGWLDVAAAPDSGGVDVWAGKGGGSWTSLTAPSPSEVFNALDLGDFDRDDYLDLLAASSGKGLLVWQGDGGGSWTSISTGLPTSGTFYDADFGRVDGDAALDIVAAEMGASGVRVWTAFEPPPGGWSSFAPTGWMTSWVVTATVSVVDAGSGLDVSTAEYRFSRDGGTTWIGGWQPATCTGSDGTTAPQTITAASVPFNQDSDTLNAIQFRIQDMAGLTGTSDAYNVRIDTTPPTNPTTLHSDSHTVGTWDNDTSINFDWDDAGSDGLSGVDGYSFDLTQNASERPDEVIDRDAGPATLLVTEHATSDGNWYFHFMTKDNAGNWADPLHLGPYRIDATPPSAPALVASSHTVGGWSNDNTIWIQWSASDGTGSGIAGYSYSWTRSATTSPDTSVDTTATSMTSSPLPVDGEWYLHILAVDNAGSVSDVSHFGPFGIDTTPPTSNVSSPGTTTSRDFLVLWNAWDVPAPQSGVDSVSLLYREKCTTPWNAWLSDQPASGSTTFHGQHGHAYEFISVAEDVAGNVEAWSGVAESTTGVATLDFEGFALEVTQAVQDLNNSVVLVAHKRTFARFHVRSLARGDQGPVSASLTAWRGGVRLGSITASNPGGTIIVRDDPDREQLNHSFYFDLPSSWLHGTVTLIAEVNPDRCLAESDYANNDQTVTVTFQDTPEMNVLLVDVCYSIGGTTYHVRDADRRALASWLRRAYPIHQLNVWWGYFASCYDDATVDSEGRLTWPNSSEVNSQLAWNHSRGVLGDDEDPYTRYYGMANEGGGFMRGRGERPGTVASGPAGSDDWGWDFDGSYADWYGGHELGHTYNRRHTRGTQPPECESECCGSEAGNRVVYPNGDISPTRDSSDPDALYGFDVETLDIYPPSWKDVMTYCDNLWLSDDTYEGIRDRMISESGSALKLMQPAFAQEYLAVFGTIYSDTNRVELDAFYRVPNAWDVFGRVPGEYSIRLLDAADATLADYPFTPSFSYVDPGPTCRTGGQAEETPGLIAEYVPWVAGTARIAIYHGAEELASRDVSPNAPLVTLTSPNGGEVLNSSQITVTWTASDADGDDLEYTLEYSVDGGAHWRTLGSGIITTNLLLDAAFVAGTDQGKFRVLASDGVNTGQDESDGTFTVPNRAPVVQITSPADGATYVPGQSVALIADAIDVEDGTLDDAALSWTSSLSGTIGTGRMLHVTDLITGTHVITVTATDSDNQPSSATVTIHVRTVCILTHDLDQSGTVDVADIQFVAAHWRSPSPGIADRNGDDQANIVDVMMVATDWGESCGQAR